MVYLTKLDLDQPQINRTYYTASQVGIAKKVKDLICSDLSVGFASQPKFGAAFKACYGVTPLEYRRMNKLEAEDRDET